MISHSQQVRSHQRTIACEVRPAQDQLSFCWLGINSIGAGLHQGSTLRTVAHPMYIVVGTGSELGQSVFPTKYLAMLIQLPGLSWSLSKSLGPAFHRRLECSASPLLARSLAILGT
jgi:hypothetical protein